MADDPPVEGLTTFEQLCKRFPDRPVTLKMFSALFTQLVQMNGRLRASTAGVTALTTRADAADQRVAALEQELADLRVALDADRAVRS